MRALSSLPSHAKPSKRSSYWRSAITGLCLAFATMLATGQTKVHDEISALLTQSQASEALSRAESALEQFPRDPQLQFLKGNAELALTQIEAATNTFTQLTQTFPELPEPWNNLATIRAQEGNWLEAQSLLNAALQSNPSYAQAHANLAEVLTQLAVQHLQTAQQLAPSAQTQARIQQWQAVLKTSPTTTPTSNSTAK